jgi:hypothetical protein
MVRIKRARVSASKSRLTSIRRRLASNTSRTLLCVLPLRRLRAILTSTNRLEPPCSSASVRRLFSPRCNVLSAKPWRLAKLHLPQSACLEFRDQASDLLSAAPFPNLNLYDVGHADSSSKSSHHDQMGWSDAYLLLALLVAIQGIAYAGDDKPEVGRYRLLSTRENGVWKIDTATGQVWKIDFNANGFIPVETTNPKQ